MSQIGLAKVKGGKKARFLCLLNKRPLWQAQCQAGMAPGSQQMQLLLLSCSPSTAGERWRCALVLSFPSCPSFLKTQREMQCSLTMSFGPSLLGCFYVSTSSPHLVASGYLWVTINQGQASHLSYAPIPLSYSHGLMFYMDAGVPGVISKSHGKQTLMYTRTKSDFH